LLRTDGNVFFYQENIDEDSDTDFILNDNVSFGNQARGGNPGSAKPQPSAQSPAFGSDLEGVHNVEGGDLVPDHAANGRAVDRVHGEVPVLILADTSPSFSNA